MCLHLITHMEGETETWVNQSFLTANIWLRAEYGNTIRDRSKGQPNQLRYAREWRKVAQGGAVSIQTTHIRNTKGQMST